VKVRLGPDGGEPTWRSVEGPDAFRDQYSIINPFHWRLFLTGLTETGAGASASLLALDVALRRVSMLDIHPQQMRGYGRRGQPLGPQGQNISGVLADLCDDPEERRTLVDWIRELCAPEVQDLDFIEVKEAGDVLAVVVEQGQRRITARSLSDGTLRFLGLVVALRSAAPGSVLLIEEVDAWFHPTRLRVLVELLQAVTRAGSVQVIATTHSPTLLQWLSDEGLRDAVLFAISPDHEGTLMRRLADVPHFEAAKRSGIEELFSTGWLERAV
jgi:hypothetical protein